MNMEKVKQLETFRVSIKNLQENEKIFLRQEKEGGAVISLNIHLHFNNKLLTLNYSPFGLVQIQNTTEKFKIC